MFLIDSMISLTSGTQDALRRIAVAPKTSEQPLTSSLSPFNGNSTTFPERASMMATKDW
jgi:hypothetical protein